MKPAALFALLLIGSACADTAVCTAPPIPPKKSPKAKMDAFNVQVKAYGECVSNYVNQQNAIIADKEKAIAQLRAEGNAAVDAGRQVTAAYNDYVKQVNEQFAN